MKNPVRWKKCPPACAAGARLRFGAGYFGEVALELRNGACTAGRRVVHIFGTFEGVLLELQQLELVEAFLSFSSTTVLARRRFASRSSLSHLSCTKRCLACRTWPSLALTSLRHLTVFFFGA